MKRFIIFLLAISLLICGNALASAETNENNTDKANSESESSILENSTEESSAEEIQYVEKDIQYLDEVKDIVFWVTYTNSKPNITIIAPNGMEYDPTITYPNAEPIESENSFYFKIKEANSGLWKVRYNKADEQNFEISMFDYTAPLYIDYFSIVSQENSIIQVKFKVSGGNGSYYKYKISAVATELGAEKVLSESSEYVGDETVKYVYLNSLTTYTNYKLKLYVWYTENEADIYDFTYSEPFSYTNSQVDSNAPDFKLTVSPESGIIHLSIPNIRYDIDSFIVAIFENDKKDPTTFDEYDKNKASDIQLAYDPQTTKVGVEVTYKFGEVNSAPKRIEFEPKNFGFTLPEKDTFNTLSIPITYNNMKEQSVSVKINGYNSNLLLNGNGNLNLTVGDDWNSVSISYTDEKNITWLLSRELFVDRIPPVLSMLQNYDNMTVENNKIVINGSVLDCSSIVINGNQVTVDKNGLFTFQLDLNVGANSVEVIASDLLGNETKYCAIIYHGVTDNTNDSSDKQYGTLYEFIVENMGLLIIAGIICVLIIIYAFVFWRKEAKK